MEVIIGSLRREEWADWSIGENNHVSSLSCLITLQDQDDSYIPGTDDLVAPTFITMAFDICTIQALSSLLGSFEALLRCGDQYKGEYPKS